MKYHPYIVTTPDALQEALKNDAAVILVDSSLLSDAQETLSAYGYLPMDANTRSGKLFQHPEAEEPEVFDPQGIL